MNFQITRIPGAQAKEHPLYAAFRAVHVEVFGESATQKIEKEIHEVPGCVLWMAYNQDKQVLGFKLGYELDKTKYYSWMGGISPSARQQGIASALMQAQHEWCKHSGYEIIQTKTMNKWRDMLLLNIKTGFDIVGTEPAKSGALKIVLEKKL